MKLPYKPHLNLDSKWLDKPIWRYNMHGPIDWIAFVILPVLVEAMLLAGAAALFLVGSYGYLFGAGVLVAAVLFGRWFAHMLAEISHLNDQIDENNRKIEELWTEAEWLAEFENYTQRKSGSLH